MYRCLVSHEKHFQEGLLLGWVHLTFLCKHHFSSVRKISIVCTLVVSTGKTLTLPEETERLYAAGVKELQFLSIMSCKGVMRCIQQPLSDHTDHVTGSHGRSKASNSHVLVPQHDILPFYPANFEAYLLNH